MQSRSQAIRTGVDALAHEIQIIESARRAALPVKAQALIKVQRVGVLGRDQQLTVATVKAIA